jgi:hypothetical protein
MAKTRSGKTGGEEGEETETNVIKHIQELCGFPEDSTMVKYMTQQGWTSLIDITMLSLDEIKDFATTKEDGSFEAKPMLHHQRILKGFLLWYNRLSRDLTVTLDEDDVLGLTRSRFLEYCGSPEYHSDMAMGLSNTKRASVVSSFNPTASEDLTAQEFRKSVKRDKTHYSDLKEDKYFNSWNRGFVATAHMHHTHLILDEGYTPTTVIEKALFQEMQVFMYAVLEEHLKTDKGKSLVSEYEPTHDAQSIYRELKKHARSSTAAQISGDTLLQYITTARYPGNWRGTSHSFVLHWKEQIIQYEKLELEDFPPKQKLRMLQNAVTDVNELAYVKQIGDQDVARGKPPLDFESYLQLLLSACSAYDRNHAAPSKQRRNVYAAILDPPAEEPPDETNYDIFHVDTDISDILAFSSSTTRSFNNVQKVGNTNKGFLPREEWLKLTESQREEILAKRRQERMKDHKVKRQVNTHEVQDLISLDDILDYQINQHTTTPDDECPSNGTPSEPSESTLLAYMAGRSPSTSPGDIRRVLAAKQTPSTKPPQRAVNETQVLPDTVQVGTTTYYLNKSDVSSPGTKQYSANLTMLHYNVSEHSISGIDKALVDRGANGSICGDDMLVLEGSERFVSVSGLAGYKVDQLRLVTARALIQTHKGPAVATFHQMAHLGKGKSILSCIQMEHFGAVINDKPTRLGGKQCIVIDGYQIPLDINGGLPYLRCRKPTPDEVANLPHLIMTADVDWDPCICDNNIDDMEQFYDAEMDAVSDSPFDQFGDYRHRTIATHIIEPEAEFFDATEILSYDDRVDNFFDALHPNEVQMVYDINTITVSTKPPDFDLIRPLFGWAPSDTIKRTFAVTTQYARGRVSDTLKQHWRSRFPACNVKRRNEPVATDTVFSDTPAVDNGSIAAQIFVGRNTLVADAYGIKTDREFVNTLEDNIRERGAMDKLISDGAKAEMSDRVKDILRALVISDWQSEPYHQNQNFAENRYATIKAATNRVLNRSGAPAPLWLLALAYVCLLLNHLASNALGWIPPNQALTGQTQDISKFLHFSFYEPVYYHPYSDAFPSATNEEQGWWVGIATTVGDALTYKILTKSNKVIYRSAIRSALDPATRNLRLSSLGGESSSTSNGDKIFIRSRTDQNEVDDSDPSVKSRTMVTIDPADLIGRTFLKDTEEDGQRFRARIVKTILDEDEERQKDPQYIKFLCSVDGDTADEILSYNEVLDHIERDNNEIDNDTEQYYKFRRISAHQGPLKNTDKDYKGSMYNVLVEWETGETTYEPLDLIAKDDPVTCAEYAQRNGLLDTPGWKRFKRLGRNEKKIERLVMQAKLHSYRREPYWKFGVLVPRTHAQAMELDEMNKNNKWQEAEVLEISQLLEYGTFQDIGVGGVAPAGYKKIRGHMVYDVKHDGRHKSRYVAGGHLTDPNEESVYSGVVSLRGIRLTVFIAELNRLSLWGADVGNAYLEAKTKEKVYIIPGGEFGALAGHTLIIVKALYGLRSSGLCWHQRFADVMRSLGFFQSKAEGDVWMRECNDHYEYIAVYVDDLLIASKTPEVIIQALQETHGFKLKGVGPLSYHLGCDYFHDKDGTLCCGPRKYIAKMQEQFERMFNHKAKEYTSPLEKGDHPETDTSEELDANGIKMYQSLIGSLQWAVSLGRFDIHTATMTMSRFRVAPRKGHLERLKRIYGYLKKFSTAAIRVRVEEPDFTALPEQDFDWCYSVYGNVEEVLPKDLPKALGNPVTTVTYKDANLYHDMVTGRSVTGILHFCNQTLVDWYSKRQSTVESATFGSEFTAARIAVDQIMDMRMTLRYLGVSVRSKSFMFGDNQAVVTNSTIPHSTLNKRHNALAYHRVREMIAAKVLGYYWIDGKSNPADIVSKHWGYQQVWTLLQPILFYSGDTGTLVDDEKVNGMDSQGTSLGDLGEETGQKGPKLSAKQ